MDITEILRQMIAERDKLNVAIASLQAIGAPKRRGRPPKNPLAALMPPPAPKRRGPKRSKAQREAQAEKMRAYWAERRKQQEQGEAQATPRKKRPKGPKKNPEA